jgi:hypothetical protein
MFLPPEQITSRFFVAALLRMTLRVEFPSFVTFVVQYLFIFSLRYCKSAWRISRYRLTS